MQKTTYQYHQEDIIMAEISFEIKENLGVLSESTKGWTKELNMVSWNGREAKYDIREWDPTHEKMGKGLTLTKDELIKLKELLAHIEG
jgi:hypothetical protein